MGARRSFAGLLAALGAVGSLVVSAVATTAPVGAITSTTFGAPVYAGDFPDPYVVLSGGTYWAYSTGSAGRNLLVARQPRRVVDISDAFGGAAIASQLRFDPIDRGAVALGALLAVAELAETPDRGLVALEIEPPDQAPDGILARNDARLLTESRCGNRERETAKSDGKSVCAHCFPPGRSILVR